MAKKLDTPKEAKPAVVAQHDMWMYSGEKAKLFKKGETIPEGWEDSPYQEKR